MMKPYKKIATTMAVQMSQDFVVVQDSDDVEIKGEVTAIRGSYLAMAATGILYPISERTFESQYVALEESDDDQTP